jgi:hypothetical protein
MEPPFWAPAVPRGTSAGGEPSRICAAHIAGDTPANALVEPGALDAVGHPV